jgi:hypothetical protein
MLPSPPMSLSEEPAFLRGCEMLPEVLNFGFIFDRLEVAKSSVIVLNNTGNFG